MSDLLADVSPALYFVSCGCPLVGMLAATAAFVLAGLWFAKLLRNKPPGPGRTP